MEDGEGLRRVEGDEDSHQELLVFGLQRQSEAVYDAEAERRRKTLYLTVFYGCSG